MLSVLALIVGLTLLCALLALLGAVVFRGSGFSFRGWRWHPSMLGITVLVLATALIFWRFFPSLLFVPIILPFFWRFRIGGRGRGSTWTVPHRPDRAENEPPPDDRAIHAQFRRVEDEKPPVRS